MDHNARERSRNSHRTVDETLKVLLDQLSPKLRRLIEARQNFKLTINATASHSFEIEIVERLRLE
jgi:hypothetical protein